ncbi:MAG: DUF6328 family protein [Polyangiaceae bacterium]
MTDQEPSSDTGERRVDRDRSGHRDPDGETKKQRVDRELNELLGELRIALPGVQMLFAFLATVPFYARFETLRGIPRGAFFVTFVCTTIAAVLMIAPSSNHRIAFRAQDKEQLLFRANRFAIFGIAFLALAMCGVMFFMAGIFVGGAWAPAASGATAALIGTTWYMWPIIRKLRNRNRA